MVKGDGVGGSAAADVAIRAATTAAKSDILKESAPS